jgi:glucan phosphoethanolaminetransferase (alkaline phosphatase superfamily)
MDLTKYNSSTNRRLVGIIASSFLATFFVSRVFVYLVLGRLLPNFFLTIRGVHIHHFTYGVVILAIVGFYFIMRRPTIQSRYFRLATFVYGVGLGLTFDEFGMWIRLKDDYWIRQSYDAIIVICLLLLNIAFYKPILHWLKEFYSVLRSLFTGQPEEVLEPLDEDTTDFN